MLFGGFFCRWRVSVFEPPLKRIHVVIATWVCLFPKSDSWRTRPGKVVGALFPLRAKTSDSTTNRAAHTLIRATLCCYIVKDVGFYDSVAINKPCVVFMFGFFFLRIN